MLEQSGYIPYVLSVHRPVIHRAYRLDVGGYGVPTAVPLPEEVFESLQYGRAQLAHGHRLPFGECRECIHRFTVGKSRPPPAAFPEFLDD